MITHMLLLKKTVKTVTKKCSKNQTPSKFINKVYLSYKYNKYDIMM